MFRFLLIPMVIFLGALLKKEIKKKQTHTHTKKKKQHKKCKTKILRKQWRTSLTNANIFVLFIPAEMITILCPLYLGLRKLSKMIFKTSSWLV